MYADEKKHQDPLQSGPKTQPGLPQPDGDQVRQKNAVTSTAKRKKKAVRLTPRALCITLLSWYQNSISPLLPDACRFYPSCSEYAKQALGKYGILKGAWKSAQRVLLCHPLSGKSGYDPLG